MGLPPLLLHLIVVLLLAGVMVGLSALLGERRRPRQPDDPYESGIVPTRRQVPPYSAPFYLVAAFFVLFDLEVVVLVTWALVARDAGWTAFVEILVFSAVLLVALFWLVRVGALDWGPRTWSLRTAARATPPPDASPGETRS